MEVWGVYSLRGMTLCGWICLGCFGGQVSERVWVWVWVWELYFLLFLGKVTLTVQDFDGELGPVDESECFEFAVWSWSLEFWKLEIEFIECSPSIPY